MSEVRIFDENGDQYIVGDINGMLKEMPDEGLEVIYKPTRYFHEFNKTIGDLIDRKIIEQTEGPEYDVEGVNRGLKAFEEEITNRLGPEVLKEWQDETDAQWEENKKDLDKNG